MKHKIKDIQFYISERARGLITQDDMIWAAEEVLKEHRAEHIEYITMNLDGEYIGYTVKTIPFNRIRRITGYLTGGVDTWNDAKRHELDERVKHVKADDPVVQELKNAQRGKRWNYY